MVVGRTETLVLKRDADEDGNPISLPPQTFLVIPPGDPRIVRGQASEGTEATGELRHTWPVDAQLDDRFRLMPENQTCRISAEPALVGAYIRIPFIIEG